jgi:hypothetical protein
MQRFIFVQGARAILGLALAASLSACVVEPARPVAVVRPAPPPPQVDRHEVAVQRFDQIGSRVSDLARRVDQHVNQGYYPPPQGGALHHRLDVIWQEARDMASQRGGGLSGEEQHALNQELDGAARAIQ